MIWVPQYAAVSHIANRRGRAAASQCQSAPDGSGHAPEVTQNGQMGGGPKEPPRRR